MITVAIIAILSAIAIPQYSEYVMRSRITEATMDALRSAPQMERYFQDNRSFTPVAPAGRAAPPTPWRRARAPAHFTFVCNVGSATTYHGHRHRHRADARLRLPVNERNVPQHHWRATGWTLAANCWALKKDGSC
jgi:type IV pilus assembly protein PilE